MTTMAPNRARTAIRRTPRGDISEVVSITVRPTPAKTIIRQE